MVTKKMLDMAIKKGDITGMLRSNIVLTKIYPKLQTKFGSPEHIESLDNVQSILKTILAYYDNAKKVLNIPKNRLLPREDYEIMLASNYIRKAETDLGKKPSVALTHLRYAQDIMDKFGEGAMTARIKKLKRMAESKMS